MIGCSVGRYFETKQQECFGTALANFLLRREGEEYARRILDEYWKQPFVESLGMTQHEFTPLLTRTLTEGLYTGKALLACDSSYELLEKHYGGGIGLALYDDLRNGNIQYVQQIKQLEVPCIVFLENSVDIIKGNERVGMYVLGTHAVVALGAHIYIDHGQLLHDPTVKIVGALQLTCNRKYPFEMPYIEPNIWKL